MSDGFELGGTGKRLLPLAAMLEERLQAPFPFHLVGPFVLEFAKQIAEELGFGSAAASDAVVRTSADADTIVVDPAELLQSIIRTLEFARKWLGGIPTLAPQSWKIQEREVTVYAPIDVFDLDTMAKVSEDVPSGFGQPPRPETEGEQSLAAWLGVVLPRHPWARLSDDAAVVGGLGVGFSLLLARNVQSSAMGQPLVVSYRVNTQKSGLVLDAFPDLQYRPRRFGSKSSTPVNGKLSTGWWRFETIVNGALTKDKGRHFAGSSKTSTTTRDF